MNQKDELEVEVTVELSIDELETEFNTFIAKMDKENEAISGNLNMDELDEIGESVIKAREYLTSFANGEKKSAREKAYNQLTNIPLLGNWAKNKAQEIKMQDIQDSSVKEVLNDIFSSFTTKNKRLVELSQMMHDMKTSLLVQEKTLIVYIKKLSNVISTTTNPTDKMRAIEMSNMAQAQEKITKEMIYNNINIISELLSGLHLKISKTLPVIKNTLNNSVNIAGTINSIKDAVEMMNTLEKLSEEIVETSSNSIQGLIINTTNSLSDGTNIEFFKNSAKRNEEFNKLFLEAKKTHIKKTVAYHEELTKMSVDLSKSIEFRQNEEIKMLSDITNTERA